MRYIADSSGYVKQVSFGADITCEGSDCAEYTGSVPAGYASLEAWYLAESEKLYRWQVVDGELALDSEAVAPEDDPCAVDYVVAEGTDDVTGWEWRKWRSGRSEAWLYQNISGVACTTALGSTGFYMTADIEITQPPEGLFADGVTMLHSFNGVSYGTSAFIYESCTTIPGNGQKIAVKLIRHSSTTIGGVINTYMTGWWS